MSDDEIRTVIEDLGFDGGDSLEIMEALNANGYVIETRAQHEALMAAKDELVRWRRDYYDGRCECRECKQRLDILAALRAAGIDLEEKHD